MRFVWADPDVVWLDTLAKRDVEFVSQEELQAAADILDRIADRIKEEPK